MARWSVGVLVFLSAALAVAVVRQAASQREMKSEIDALRAKVDRIEARGGPSRTALEEVREEIARVERKAQTLAAVAPAGESAGKPGALPTLLTEEDIQKVVDERLDQKVEEKLQAKGGKKGGGDGDRKMPLHDLAKELTLDAATQTKVAEIANSAKKDIFTLISTPRANGTTFVDELLDVVFKGGDQSAMVQLYMKLFNEKIPGTDTTYAAGVENIQKQAYQYLEGAMGTDAFTQFRHMNVHPENIQTGFDPLAEYVVQKGIDPSKFGPKK